MLRLTRDDGFLLSDDRELLDLDLVNEWLSRDAWWALGRTLEQTRAIVAASMAVGVYRDGRQVAFLRALTDGVVFAYLADVYVDRPSRGLGLGTWMVKGLCEHLDTLGVGRIALATTDAHAVYARAGFADVPPKRWMLRVAGVS